MECQREGFCPIFSLRLRQGSVEFQTASRLAAKFGSFNGDEDQVFRTGRSVEIPRLLEFGRPFSGLMRKAILKQVKTETESRVEPNPPKVWTKE
jgi:hypothetical protein